MVHQGTDRISTMVEYADRLKKAMEDANVTVAALARGMKLSYQGVKKVLEGRSNAFNAANNDQAARFLGVSPSWLATGRGPKRMPDNVGHHVAEPDATFNGIKLTDRALSLATRFDALTNELHAATLYATMSTLLDGYEADQRENARQTAKPGTATAPAPRVAKPRPDPVR
ncbi:hypothetical protein DBR42_04610 [Pelomonas sp. HMWF004]|nr:hypothetical protein DBR42_04610 [Pelomonas sp. HMWF004]